MNLVGMLYLSDSCTISAYTRPSMSIGNLPEIPARDTNRYMCGADSGAAGHTSTRAAPPVRAVRVSHNGQGHGKRAQGQLIEAPRAPIKIGPRAALTRRG